MIKAIKKRIPESIKISIKMLFISSNNSKWANAISDKKKNVYVFLCGFYQNLGDMALTYSQECFLKKEFPNANIVLIPSGETYVATKSLKRRIKKYDLVTILGGGNMDDLYCSLEDARLHVIKSFPNNQIICFPQTYAFSKTSYGLRREKKSIGVYKRHKDLTIFVREHYSLDRIRKSMPTVNIKLCPDMVLSLRVPLQNTRRDKVLFCFRSDNEQVNDIEFNNKLLGIIRKQYENVIVKDTVDISIQECSQKEYKKTLHTFWELLQNCRVVFTDRLHCMLFCVITGTPCVVMDNSNHKIKGVFNAWLKNIPYIKMVDHQCIDSIISEARKIDNMNCSQLIPDFSDSFAPLRRSLHE